MQVMSSRILYPAYTCTHTHTHSYIHIIHSYTYIHSYLHPTANAGASVEVCFCYFDHQHTLRAQSSTFTIVDPHATLEEDNAHSHHVAAGNSEEQTPFKIHIYRKHQGAVLGGWGEQWDFPSTCTPDIPPKNF